MNSAQTAPDRRYDVDALRTLAVLLLVVFHTARLFDAEPWHMKDLEAPYWAADFVVRLLNIWQMPLLFLLAGMSAAWALERRSAGSFATERVQRLLVPLVIGMVVFVAPQVWVERISPEVALRTSPIDFDGGPFAFLATYARCCYPDANLSWHHLWFLPYLFVYSMALLLVAGLGRAGTAADWLARAPWRLCLPALLLIAIEWALRPQFPSTHDLVSDWANHAHYLSLVVLGWWIARNPALEAAIAETAVTSAIAAALLTALWLATQSPSHGGFGLLDAGWAVRMALRVGAEWATLLALLGLGRRFLDRPIPALRAFVPLSLAFYIIHQTVIVLLGRVLLDWTAAPTAKFVTIALISAGLSLALARLGAAYAPTRIILGLRPPREPARLAA